MRACLYARYSSDNQSQNSIADQLRAGRERAMREGWEIVATHADEGISGATPVAMRAGGKALIAAALADRFDVLIVEGLDRVTRDLSEQERKTLQATLEAGTQRETQNNLADIAAGYKRLVLNLQDTLAADSAAAARPVLAGLLGPITLVRNAETGESWARMRNPAEQLVAAAGGASLNLVARGRFGHEKLVPIPNTARRAQR